MTHDLRPFVAWLSRHYRPRSVDKITIDLRSYLRNPQIATRASVQRQHDYARAYRIYQTFCARVRGAAPLDAPPPSVQSAPELRRRRKRKLEAVSIDEPQWLALGELVRAHPSAAARVLEVMMATGLRVADVLRVTPAAIEGGLGRADGIFSVELKGGKTIHYPVRGAEAAWRALLASVRDAPNVAAAVSPTGTADPEANGSAYHSVRKLFAELCGAAGVSGRRNLHRIRRTVAVRLLRREVPLDVVQQVLGHSSIRTTQRYTDEHMPDRVAAALRRLT